MFPDFFSTAPSIRLYDPLAEFLGAASDGCIDYRYADAVRLAGHSCPTVATAFLMTRAALGALYGSALPVRGEIRVDLAEPAAAGVAGVIAAVAGLVTGACAETGFRGLGGRFSRRDLLRFGQPLPGGGTLRFCRLDSGRGIAVAADLARVPGDPRIAELMPLCLHGKASATDQTLFRTLWQERVRQVLERADDPQTIRLIPD